MPYGFFPNFSRPLSDVWDSGRDRELRQGGVWGVREARAVSLLLNSLLKRKFFPHLNLRGVAQIIGITQEIREQVSIFYFSPYVLFPLHSSEENSNSYILVKGSKSEELEGPVSGQPCPATGRNQTHEDAARHRSFHLPL